MSTTKMDKLTELTKAYKKLGEEIEALKSQKPWEPTGHEWVAALKSGHAALLCEYDSQVTSSLVKNGRTYPTAIAAEKASEFFHFYQRLYALAYEMNQKHKNDEDFYLRCMCFNKPCRKWNYIIEQNHKTSGILFTSHNAAQEAADIMNRDNWVIPTL